MKRYITEAILIMLAVFTCAACAETFYCDSCTDCNEKIQNASMGDVVILTVDITDCDGNCIEFNDADGITFDGGNHIIDGDGDSTGNGIYLPSYSNSNTLKNCEITGFCNGIYLENSDSNNLQNITCINNHGNGIFVRYCSYNTLENTVTNSSNQSGIYLRHSPSNKLTNIISSSNVFAGVYIDNSSSTIINNSHIINNFCMGINIYNDGANLIYNNYFSNTDNINFAGTTVYANDWNVTNTAGPNIIGGPFIGGNYWSDYDGDDTDGDGFGEAAHNIGGGSNQDHLPLVYAPATCGDITGDGNIDTVDLVLLLEYVVKGTPVNPCTGDIDGNGHINSLDVLMLMGYINNPAGYSLNCGC